jgi:hypothetical protein
MKKSIIISLFLVAIFLFGCSKVTYDGNLNTTSLDDSSLEDDSSSSNAKIEDLEDSSSDEPKYKKKGVLKGYTLLTEKQIFSGLSKNIDVRYMSNDVLKFDLERKAMVVVETDQEYSLSDVTEINLPMGPMKSSTIGTGTYSNTYEIKAAPIRIGFHTAGIAYFLTDTSVGEGDEREFWVIQDSDGDVTQTLPSGSWNPRYELTLEEVFGDKIEGKRRFELTSAPGSYVELEFKYEWFEE